MNSPRTHIREVAPFRWDGVPQLAYKEDGGTHFKGVTRQVLFDCDASADVTATTADPALATQLRYFEIAPGGHSTLERHDHIHAVMIVRGAGRVLVGREIHDVAAHDLLHVPPQTWHQFRATGAEPLGFLCLVRCDRDKPLRPTATDLATLRSDATVADFIRV